MPVLPDKEFKNIEKDINSEVRPYTLLPNSPVSFRLPSHHITDFSYCLLTFICILKTFVIT